MKLTQAVAFGINRTAHLVVAWRVFEHKSLCRNPFLSLHVAAWEFEKIAKSGHPVLVLRSDCADKSPLLVVIERSLWAAAKADWSAA
jgi:hypothetical protein